MLVAIRCKQSQHLTRKHFLAELERCPPSGTWAERIRVLFVNNPHSEATLHRIFAPHLRPADTITQIEILPRE